MRFNTTLLMTVAGFSAAVAVFAAREDFEVPYSLSAALTVRVNGLERELSIDGGEPFHLTINEVVDKRLVEVPDSSIRLGLWNEVTPEGSMLQYYAVSLDGRHVDRVRGTSYVLKLRYARFDPLASLPEIPPHLRSGPGNRLFIVQFVTQPLGAYRDAIEIRGGRIVRFLANHAYIVEMPGETRAEVERLAFVRWVGDYHTAYRLETALVEAVRDPSASLDALPYNILATRFGALEQGSAGGTGAADKVYCRCGARNRPEPPCS